MFQTEDNLTIGEAATGKIESTTDRTRITNEEGEDQEASQEMIRIDRKMPGTKSGGTSETLEVLFRTDRKMPMI